MWTKDFLLAIYNFIRTFDVPEEIKFISKVKIAVIGGKGDGKSSVVNAVLTALQRYAADSKLRRFVVFMNIALQYFGN